MQEAIDFNSTIVLGTDDLKKGMYVSYLDRPWLESPFASGGFEIQTDEDLDRLRQNCEYVFIQTERGNYPDGYDRHLEATAESEKKTTQNVAGLAKWEVNAATEHEYRAADAALGKLRNAVIHALEAASHDDAIDIIRIRDAIEPLRESVERCPDAALYAIRLSDAGDYLYRHAVACTVLSLIIGRALGLPGNATANLAVGCALLDIGKLRVPEELLNRPNTVALTSGEMAELHKHVEHSVDIIEACPGVGSGLKSIIAYHHERHNGSGYPEGLKGDQIPLPARIAGIVDLYDAMISHRTYGRRATPHEAMCYIRQRRGKDFCPLLTDQFVNIFGLYPTGSLVELSNGKVGRVIQQHPTALLTPRVQLILDANKQRLNEYRSVDLAPNIGHVDSLGVARCLQAGSYGIES